MYKKEVFFVLIFTILFLFAFTAESKSENVYLSHDKIIVLKADVVNFLITLSGTKDDVRFNKILEEINSESDTSLQVIILSLKTKLNEQRLSFSDYFGDIGFNDDDIVDKLMETTGNAIENSIIILIKRLEHSGIIYPAVYKTGSMRISIEIPGEIQEEIKTIVQTTGRLTFNLCKDDEYAKKILQDIDKALFVSAPASGTKQLTQYFDMGFSEAFKALIANEKDVDKIDNILKSETVKVAIPVDASLCWAYKEMKGIDDKRYKELHVVKKEPELTEQVITDATFEIDKNTEMPYVSLEMNEVGTQEWERITGENINKKCAIIFDGIVYSTPVIKSKIIGGKTLIHGMATMKEVKILSILLKSGALEIPLKIIE